jgi:anion-transporting  ArsA/GET3 family ATPase
MLRDTTEFFESMEGMYDHIRERIRIVDRMFADERTGFVVVTSPERESIDQTVGFWELLVERGLAFSGSVVNRIEPLDGVEPAEVDELVGLPGIDADLAMRITACQHDHVAVGKRDRDRVRELRSALGDAPVLCVPRMPKMINDLPGLASMGEHLYSGR